MANELAGTVARLEREWPLPEQVAADTLGWIEKTLPARESAYVRQAGRLLQAQQAALEAAAAREARLRGALSTAADALRYMANHPMHFERSDMLNLEAHIRAALAGPAQEGEARDD